MRVASGPYPELNVVDMLVFVMLARGALEEYWIPTELGARGQPLLDAFTRTEERTRHLSAKILSVEQQEAVRELVADWRRRHPGVFVVEGVRFEQFAYRVGEVPELRPLLEELTVLTKNAGSAAHEARLLAEASVPLLDRLVGPSVALAPGAAQNGGEAAASADVLGRLDAITRRSETLLRELRVLLPADPEAAARAVEDRVESLARRIAMYCLIVGLGWAIFFWTGYYLVKR